SGPNPYVGSGLSTQITGTLVTRGDYFAIQLAAGQSATVGLTGLGGVTHAVIDLEDGSGTVLATSTTAANLDAVIGDFVAAATGTYYIHVTGNRADPYNLVITRGAGFDTESNDDLAHAQDLVARTTTGQRVALGALTGSRLFAVADDFSSTIVELDP